MARTGTYPDAPTVACLRAHTGPPLAADLGTLAAVTVADPSF